MNIKKMQPNDWEQVASIYQEGIDTGNATFETQCPPWEVWDEKHRKDCRFVAKENDKIAGWIALSGVSVRAVYSGVCEVSVYIASEFKNKGVGSLLMQALIEESERHGIWTLQAAIFPENEASIHLHEKFGFRQVGIREKIGKREGIWRDNVFLERRSKIAGIE
ncbi:MAG: N-acetyltransferase [Bacteroidales bacterium]|nr:N-acetyltransferase [Bacteroidales bacterium]